MKKNIIICGKGKIIIDTLKICKEILKNHNIIYCYIEEEQKKINCVKFANSLGFICHKLENFHKLFELCVLYKPQYILSIQFSMIFKSDLIKIFDKKIINLHHGNLPLFRGVGPITQAILSGSKKFGVTLHFIDSQIDCGRIILQKTFNIFGKTNEQIYDDCIKNDLLIIHKLLKKINKNTKLKSKTQDDSKASYFSKNKLNYQDPIIDFDNSSNQILLFCLAYFFPSQNLFPILVFKNKRFLVKKIPHIGDRTNNNNFGIVLEGDFISVSSRDRWIIFEKNMLTEL